MSKLNAKWIQFNGQTFAVDASGNLMLVLDGTGGLEITADGIGIKDGALTADMIADASITEAKLADKYIRADGANAFTASQSMGNFNLTDLAAPTSATDAVNMQYVHDLVNGIDRKASVQFATTPAGGNINLAAPAADGQVDGGAIFEGVRLLIKDQTDATENGIYIVNAEGAYERAPDADGTDLGRVTVGMTTFIEGGATNKSTTWSLTSPDAGPNGDVTVGMMDVAFIQTAAAGEYQNGAGLAKNGLIFSVDLDTTKGLVFSGNKVALNVDETIFEFDAGKLAIAAGGIQFQHIDVNMFGNGFTTITNQIVLGVLTSEWDLGGAFTIVNVPLPTADDHVASKGYVDSLFANVTRTKTAIITLSPADITAKSVEIGETATTIKNVNLFVQGGNPQLVGVDFTVTAGASGPAGAIEWSGKFLESILAAGDTLSVQWDA